MKTRTLPDFSTQPDYRLSENWFFKPSQPTQKTDVFYLVPTGYFKTPSSPMICHANNPALRVRALEQIKTKGSAFFPAGNFFAPAYRQFAVECIANFSKENQKLLLQGPVASSIAAFDYYIKHLNGGRPFILAGHSQGSMMLQFILSTYFKRHPDVQKRMIAAYVIGYSVTKNYLAANPHLKFAACSDDTGTIISYNTEAPNYNGPNLTLLPNALSINPISWSCLNETAPATLSCGSLLTLRDESGQLKSIERCPHLADATVNLTRGTVICSTVPPQTFRIYGAEKIFPEGVMHTGDLSLYYFDLQKNAQDRVNAFLQKK